MLSTTRNRIVFLALQVLLLAQSAYCFKWVTVKEPDDFPKHLVTYAAKGRTFGVCRIPKIAAGRISMFSKLCEIPYHGGKTYGMPYQALASNPYTEEMIWKSTTDVNEIKKRGVKVVKSARNEPKMYVCVSPKAGPGKLMIYGNNEMECIIAMSPFEYREKNFLVLLAESPDEVKFTRVKYSLDKLKVLSTKPVHLAKADLVNKDIKEKKIMHRLDYTKISENSWGKSAGFQVGVKASVTAGVPHVVDSKFEISASTDYKYTYGKSQTDRLMVSLTATVNVPPKHSCHVRIVAKKITVNLPYTGQMIVSFKDGSRKSKRISGVYDGVSVSQDTVKIGKCLPLSED